MEALRHPRLELEDPDVLEGFVAGLHGTVVLPDDPGYEEARLVKSAAADRRPALIVQACDAADVARTVNLARETERRLSVRGGSHSLAGFGTNDGGIVLDLSGMKALHIDPESPRTRPVST